MFLRLQFETPRNVSKKNVSISFLSCNGMLAYLQQNVHLLVSLPIMTVMQNAAQMREKKHALLRHY